MSTARSEKSKGVRDRKGLRLLAIVLLLSVLAPACGGGGGSGGGGVPPGPAGSLGTLIVSSGTLSPAFAPGTFTYSIGPGLIDSTVTVTATEGDPGSTILVNGTPVASGASSPPIALPTGVTVISIAVTPPGGSTTTYMIVIDRTGPQGQEAYLKASNTETNDGFGYNGVAISGDTIVIGARHEDSNATGINGDDSDNSAMSAGAAYVFRRTGGVWAQEAYLKGSNTEASDIFGWSVAISGDTIVVGAPAEDSSATGVNGNEADNLAALSGAAYVFVRTGGVWAQEAYLKASNTGPLDEFGFAVAIDGDTIVVTADREASSATGVDGNQADNSLTEAGAAYVFTRTGTVWTQDAYLKASNTEATDYFGWSVAVSGDTVVVGARYEDSAATGVDGNQADNSAIRAGAAYVFKETGGTWSQEAYLKASNSAGDDRFGRTVSISGNTIVVGAFGEDSNATGVNGNEANNSAASSGAAYVFIRTGGVWSQEAYLKASNTQALDDFGWSVAIDGDTIVVGASREGSSATGVNGNQADNGASISGAAYIFARTGAIWSQSAYLKASNTDSIDYFGFTLGVSGDTVVVGAAEEDSNATGVNGNQADNTAFQAGAAYVFR